MRDQQRVLSSRERLQFIQRIRAIKLAFVAGEVDGPQIYQEIDQAAFKGRAPFAGKTQQAGMDAVAVSDTARDDQGAGQDIGNGFIMDDYGMEKTI